jgi:hypothetical protein
MMAEAADDQGPAPGRGHEQTIGDAALEVLDRRHPVPAAGEERRHHEHARNEVLLVVATLEAGDVDHALEQLAEQEQPDDRLHQHDRDEPGLAPEAQQVADRQGPGVG